MPNYFKFNKNEEGKERIIFKPFLILTTPLPQEASVWRHGNTQKRNASGVCCNFVHCDLATEQSIMQEELK